MDVKFSLPLLLAAITLTFALNACTTLANRRDLYRPPTPQGPYTDMLLKRQISETVTKAPARAINHGAGSYQATYPAPLHPSY